MRLNPFRMLFALILLFTGICGQLSAQTFTNCDACWLSVRHWRGTYTTTATASGSDSGCSAQLNSSSQGSFEIIDGVSTVTGTGSINESYSCSCAPNAGQNTITVTGSGAIDSHSTVGVFIDPTVCGYRFGVADAINIIYTTTSCDGGSASSPPFLESPEYYASVTNAQPLPDFGEALVGTETYTGPWTYGATLTVTISWNAEAVVDPAPPRFLYLPTGGPLGCNPTNSPPDDQSILGMVDATAANAAATIESEHVDVTNGCTVTRTFSLTAKDKCNDTEAHATVAFWWTEDTEPPVINSVPSGGNLGCNPATPPTDASIKAQVTVIDDCDLSPVIQVTHADTTSGCALTRTFSITATDECGNASNPRTVVFTWKTDHTPPTITAVPSGGDLGCNPPSTPSDGTIKGQVTATDDCGAATINVSHADTLSGCTVTRTFSITASDACGNVSPARSVIFTWTADTAPPTITQVPPGGYLGINPTNIPTEDIIKAGSLATDDCSVPQIAVSSAETTNDCIVTLTFFVSATDTCGNVSAMRTVVYTWSLCTNSAPLLAILRSGTNIVLAWPTNATGFNLESRAGLSPSDSWASVPTLPAIVGDRFMVTNPAAGSSRFFRLKK